MENKKGFDGCDGNLFESGHEVLFVPGYIGEDDLKAVNCFRERNVDRVPGDIVEFFQEFFLGICYCNLSCCS